MFGFEIRISPHRAQLRVTDIVGVRGRLDIHRIAHRWHFAGLGIGLAIVRQGDVIDLFLRVAVLVPALDDLHPVQVAAIRILERPDGKGRRLVPGRHPGQVAAHGYPALVRFRDKVLVLVELLVITPTTEETQADQRT